MRGRAESRATLDELLDTLKLLEEEPELLPCPRAYHKDKYSWSDEVTGLRPHRSRRLLPASVGTLMRARWGLLGCPE